MLSFFDNSVESPALMEEVRYAITGHYGFEVEQRPFATREQSTKPKFREVLKGELRKHIYEKPSAHQETKPMTLADKIRQRRDSHIEQIRTEYPESLRAHAIEKIVNRPIICRDESLDILAKIEQRRLLREKRRA